MKALSVIILISLSSILHAQIMFSLDYCDCTDAIESIDPLPNGLFKRHCNDKLIIEGKFIDGEKDGSWLTYSANGVLVREFNYNKGLLTGNVQMFYSTGVRKLKGQFVNGRKEGVWEYYSEKGKLLKMGEFKNGEPIGEWHIYGLKGKKPRITYDFENGEYLKNNNKPFLFKKAAVIQNDNSHEWYIRQESAESLDDESSYPFEGFGISRELHTVIMEIPLDVWETYISNNYVAELTFVNKGIESIELTLDNKHNKEGGEIGFFAITNDIEKLHKVDHNKLSISLLEYNIKEALWMTGPWIMDKSKIKVYTPYVINQFKNRTF